MNLDYALLLIVGVFALWGAFTGFARQLASVVAAIAGWFAAKPTGEVWAPVFVKATGWSEKLSTLATTVITFIVIYLLVRWLVTTVVRRVLAGKDPDNRTLDRVLGFIASGAKIFGLVWVALSALAYVEKHVSIQGRRPFSLPSDSRAVKWVRENNLFDYLGTTVEPSLPKLLEGISVRDAVSLQKNPHFIALRKNPLFMPLLNDSKVQSAVEKGQWSELAQNPTVQRALADPDVLEHLRGLASDLGSQKGMPR